jgi:hypothetical protein
MNLFEKLISKIISKKAQSITSTNRLVDLSFKKSYRVIKRKDYILLYDDLNSNWTLNISAMRSIDGVQFNVEETLINELESNANAIIRELGKYGAVCSAIRSGDEVQYNYVIGEQEVRVLATLMVYDDLNEGANEVCTEVDNILSSLTINKI